MCARPRPCPRAVDAMGWLGGPPRRLTSAASRPTEAGLSVDQPESCSSPPGGQPMRTGHPNAAKIDPSARARRRRRAARRGAPGRGRPAPHPGRDPDLPATELGRPRRRRVPCARWVRWSAWRPRACPARRGAPSWRSPIACRHLLSTDPSGAGAQAATMTDRIYRVSLARRISPMARSPVLVQRIAWRRTAGPRSTAATGPALGARYHLPKRVFGSFGDPAVHRRAVLGVSRGPATAAWGVAGGRPEVAQRGRVLFVVDAPRARARSHRIDRPDLLECS